MFIRSLLCLSLTHLAGAALAQTPEASLTSPDGRLSVQFSADAGGAPTYAVASDSKVLVTPSKLGLLFRDTPAGAFAVVSETRTTHDETWRPVCGERSEIRDHFNELTVKLKEAAPPGREMDVIFRAYDEGVAFRYVLPKQADARKVVIRGELSEFRFSKDFPCHATNFAQGVYSRVPMSKIKPGAERPLVVETDGEFVALGEAGLVDFARMKFAAAGGGEPGVVAGLDGEVTADLPLTTPWRVIQCAVTPGKLLENNAIYLNLNPPCAIADTTWIKPGTVMREMTLTTEGARKTVDFCAAHKVGYMLFDAGWYGDEWSPKSDATRVNVDPKRSKGPLDLPEIIRYAKSKDVGVILYVNGVAMEKQLDVILPLYRKWGVKGLKYGFVPVGDQRSTAFISRAIRLAAENGLMLDIHDELRPTGTQRTWPNLMTVEGIRGDEEADRRVSQSVTHLFTRFLCGPADNTVCYFDKRVDKLSDHAYQLGKSVCFFSPWQTIYWYDRPAKPGESLKSGDNKIGVEPELGFFDRLPTTWDETHVLDGEIGRHAAVARRSGESWRIGVMNADAPHTFRLKADFLKPGRNYEAVVYTNDPSVPTRTHVKIERRRVDATSTIELVVGKNSGAALEISPSEG